MRSPRAARLLTLVMVLTGAFEAEAKSKAPSPEKDPPAAKPADPPPPAAEPKPSARKEPERSARGGDAPAEKGARKDLKSHDVRAEPRREAPAQKADPPKGGPAQSSAAERKADPGSPAERHDPAPAAAAQSPDPPSAEPSPPKGADGVGPGAGTGDRHVRPVEPPASPALTPTPGAPAAAERGHRTGKAPAKPRSTLPEGTASAVPDDDARRQIAGGPTADDLSAAKNDPELRELRDAERVLFPRPLRGARAGWSWDLPTGVDDGSPDVEASGLPLGQPLPPASSPRASAKEAEWVKSLVLPNLPTRLDARVVKYLKFYRDDARGKNILRIWAKKSGRFTPALKAEFARAGLSTDLVFLSLIESGHNPTILSPAGAAGLWQFVPESARMYGLTVDRWVDERLDPERSTEAAVRYLSDLRSRFGTWELAMAAYNMGHGGLLRAMRKFNTNDFWVLSRFEAGLPWETTLYVPKIMATAIAMANKKAFGIDDVEPDPPISFDTVSVGPNTDLTDVARAAEAPAEEVRALNAEYLAGRTPPVSAGSRRWPVRVPSGRGLVAEQRLAAALRPHGSQTEPHVIRFGDTLDTIAAEYGITAKELAQENRVGPEERLRAGSVLLVPVRSATVPGPTPEEVVVVPARRFGDANGKRVFYRVLPGDRLADVAAAFGVTPSELSLWNAVDESALLQQGMTLQVFVRPDADLSRVRYLAEHEVRVLVAGSEEFFEYFESQNGRKRVAVTARSGDTLASIGRRYGMSAAMMERINRVPAQTAMVPGQRIVVYAKGEVDGSSAPTEAPQELSAVLSPAPDALPPLPPGPSSPSPNGARSVVP